ncbi:putative ribonuclease H-like domain-containing protein [Tanacetum coccineum]
MLWHKRLGHINFKNINKLVKDNIVRGLPTKRFENDQTCVSCLKGKQHRASCKSKVLNPITKHLFMLHMDLFGPTFVSNLMHKKYCLVVTDDYNRFTWAFFLTTKDETSEILKNFIKEIENLVDKKVKIIRSDNGTEFKNNVLDDFCKEKGIKREYSIARIPQQNGVAERRNMTLIEAARTMLADSKLPITFWAEVVSTACYVQNRVLVVKPHNKTPYELFRGFKPALSFMRPFGCHVTILNTFDSLGKFDGKSDEENKPMIEGNDPKWLLELTSLNPIYELYTSYFDSPTKDVENGEPKTADDAQKQVEDDPNNENVEQERFADDSSTKDVNAAGQHGITFAYSTEDEPEVDLGNITNSYIVPTTPNTRIHKDHPIDNVIGEVKSSVQRKNKRMTKPAFEQIETKLNITKALSDIILGEAQCRKNFCKMQTSTSLILVDLPLVESGPYGTKMDDIIFGSTNKELCTVFEKLMKDKFQMSSMGELTFFLDSSTTQEDGYLSSGSIYSRSSALNLPLIWNRPWVKDEMLMNVDVNILIDQLIGSSIKRIFRYLKGKPTLGLWYSRDSPIELVDILAVTLDSNQLQDLLTKGFDAGRINTVKHIEYLMLNASPLKKCLREVKYGWKDMLYHKYVQKNRKHLGMSKEVGTPRYLSLVVPLKKVGDETVHKELGDRMERAATTTSSLEPEVVALVPNPRGDVNAQTRFEITSKQSNDPHLSRGYTLGSGEDIQLMLATAKVQMVNEVRQLQALVDKKRVIVTESSIRRDLHLDDAEGTDCLPIVTIFEELARMGYEKPSQKLTFYKAFFSPQWKYFIHTITQCLSAKSTAWNEFSSTMASLIICLATNQKFNLSKYIFDAMVKHLDGGVKFLMYPRFIQVFINQQLGNTSHHKKIFVNPFHTKKVFANMKRPGKDFSGRITPLFDTMMVQASKEVGEDSDHSTDSTQVPILDQPSTSSKPKKKQPSKKTQRQEKEVSQDETEHEESVPTPSNDPQPSGEDSMQLTYLMVLCTKLQAQVLDLEKAKDAQAKEIAALKKRVQKLERKKMSRPTGLKRLKKVGMYRRVESFEDQESLGAPEDAFKQGRSIADIDTDVEVTLVDETQERQDDELMFDTGVLDADEMPVEAKVDEKDEQSTKLDDSTAGEAVTTASVEDSAAPTTIEEITLAQTLIQIKAAKPKVVTTAATTTTTTRPKAKGVVVQEPSEFRVPQEAQPSISKDK